jgi:hypothetical protein
MNIRPSHIKRNRSEIIHTIWNNDRETMNWHKFKKVKLKKKETYSHQTETKLST